MVDDGGGVLWLTTVVLDGRGDLDLLLVETAAVEAAVEVEAGFFVVLAAMGFLEKKEKRLPCFRLPLGGAVFPFEADDDDILRE